MDDQCYSDLCRNLNLNQYKGFIEAPAGFNFCYIAEFNTPDGFQYSMSGISAYRFSILNQQSLVEVAYSTTNVESTSYTINTFDKSYQANQVIILVSSQSFLQLSRGTYYYEFIVYDNANNPVLLERGVMKLI